MLSYIKSINLPLTLILLFFCSISFAQSASSNLFSADTITACDSVVLTLDPSYSQLLWSTGDTTRSVTIDSSSTVYVTAKDSTGSVLSDTVVVIVKGVTPVADFVIYITSNSDIQVVAMPVSGASYFWDFGDGGFDTGKVVNHSYIAAGTFIIKLVVTTVCGSDTSFYSVFIPGPPPGCALDESQLKLAEIYPNPASKYINVIPEMNCLTRINILNGSGTTFYSRTITSSEQLDVSSLPPGMYILQVIQDDNITTERLFIQ